jgi:hypothetical protein
VTSREVLKKVCKTCKVEFVIPPDMEAFYVGKGLHLPARCKACRKPGRESEGRAGSAPQRGLGQSPNERCNGTLPREGLGGASSPSQAHEWREEATKNKALMAANGGRPLVPTDAEMAPDWKKGCEVCGQKPTLPLTGLCGPCTFGEADTAGGNW